MELESHIGRVVSIDGIDWVTLYRVPVANENSKLFDFYVAVKVGEPMPALCHLVMVPKLEKVPEPVSGSINVDKPA